MNDRLIPISWKGFVKKLKLFGFKGPYVGGKHPYMVKGNLVLTIPNPHKGSIGIPLLIRILKQANISKIDWVKK